MNTGPCVGGPLDGTPSISKDSDILQVRVAVGFDTNGELRWAETTYRWRKPRHASVIAPDVDIANAPFFGYVYKVPGYWEWEHHQEREDLPADRN